MSAKSLLRYRSAVGGDDLLSPAPGDKKSSGDHDQGSGRESGHSRNRLEEDDSFDEGIDDILAQVLIFASSNSSSRNNYLNDHFCHYLDFHLSPDLLIKMIFISFICNH